MQTKKFSNKLAMIGLRLMIFASMLGSAFVSNVAPAAAAVNGITISAQSGTLTYASAAGSATYSVTVTRSSGTPSSFTLNLTGLPAGVSYSPTGSISFSGLSSRTVTLTLTKTASLSLAAGTYPFVIRASIGTGVPSANGQLVISKAAQAINFPPIPNKTSGDPDFNVSATGGASGNPVTFSALGSCTVTGTLVHLTGVGGCSITASQAGNTNYNAAPNITRSFLISNTGPGATINLCATTGSLAVPGDTVPVWGYALGDCSGSPSASVPGPQITVEQGDVVTITLHNNLAEPTALLFQGQSMVPDLNGAGPSGGTQTYSFIAARPGTFLYEAGLLGNAEHQVAMGMYGALIVRPVGFTSVPGQAYSAASTAFASESVLVLSELDTALNDSAAPASFDMRNYNPKYFLINGKVFPNTDPIAVAANQTVLLRYVNAGLQAHAMSTLGLSQTIIAQDGSPYSLSHKVVAETIATGQTLDTLVAIPATAANGIKFAVYDANMLLRNNSVLGPANSDFGGMLTFLTAGTPPPPPTDTTGPETLNVMLPAGPLNGSTNAAMSASVSDVNTGNANVTAAEYFIDATGANGSGTAMSGSFGSPTANVTATISAATIGGLTTGSHLVYVHGQDLPGNWGSFNQGVLNVDNAPPTVTSPSVSPSPTNGGVNVSLTATADDTATGNSIIGAAEYWIDGGSPSPMNVISGAPQSGLSATISAVTVLALTEGSHTNHIHAKDVLNASWGPETTVSLIVDKTGPNTSAVTAAPNPNNGALPFNTSVPAVRVTATFTDPASGGVNSSIAAAEGFIDVVGANGTGFVFIASDGNFNSTPETGYSDIPLAVVNSLSTGDHTIYVHGKDAAGNWGSTSTTILVIDRTAPTIVSINRANPSPTSAASVNFTVTFSEAVTGVTSANFTLVQGGGLTGASISSISGTGATRTVAVSTGSGGGTLGLNLTSTTGITDVAGNALSSTGVPFVGQVYTLISPPLYFSTSGTNTVPGVGGTADDADIYFWSGTAFSRTIDASAAPYNLPASGGGNANVDGFDRVDATHFYMSFNGNVTITGLGTVQDEDIVYFNAGTWSVYFDGTSLGLGGTTTSTSFDLDAISIVGAGGPGNVYFSTDNNNVPPGAGGTGDDADIYRWNGGSSYTRVADASVLGWSTDNVDGLVWVSATEVYLSYSVDTSVPVLGTVQDEDVVHLSSGSWSVYFDGTGKGLTSTGHDVDAFDIP